MPQNRNAFARLVPQPRRTGPSWIQEDRYDNVFDDMLELYEDDDFTNVERPLTRHRKPGHLGAWMDYEPPKNIEPLKRIKPIL